jgi:hypothetical protein
VSRTFFSCDESVSRRSNNPGTKSLEKQAFGERDCNSTVTRTLQLFGLWLRGGAFLLGTSCKRSSVSFGGVVFDAVNDPDG